MGMLREALDALVAIEEQIKVAEPKVTVMPLQPVKRPTTDCVWNWIAPDESEAEFIGTGPTHRDKFVIRATVAVRESADHAAQAFRLIDLTDAFLNVIDPALQQPFALGSCTRIAKRIGMNTSLYRFDQQSPPLLAMDFPIEVELRRNTFG